MNAFQLIGRLTADPELRTTSNGKNVCHFTLARNHRTKRVNDKPIGQFFNLVVWEQGAEYLANYGFKGQRVAAQGYIEIETYTDKQGNDRTAVKFVATSVECIDRPRDDQPANESRALTPSPAEGEYDPFADE